MSLPETVLEAIRGDDNVWNFDITGDIDSTDAITFRAARKKANLTDALALFVRTRAAGITDVSAAQGQFQVKVLAASTAALTTDEALVFHCVVHKADTGNDTTVAEGVIRF